MSAKRRPSLPPMPDLDHLTEEERKIIESVIQRQREEEEKEQEILRSVMSLRPSQIRICLSPVSVAYGVACKMLEYLKIRQPNSSSE